MDILLYKVADPPNKVEKTLKNSRKIENVRFIEKGNLDILNPQILINLSAEISDIAKYNYMKIPKFNRYYYIDSISTEGGLIRVTGRCDALMSHADDIMASKQYVLRQESKYKNPYLFDNLLPIRSDHNYIGQKVGNPVFLKNCGRVLLATTGKGGRVI